MNVDMSLIGRRCGRLTVLAYSHTGKRSLTYWRCKCDCGNECVADRGNLNSGAKRSCGCLWSEAITKAKRTHGMSKTPTYKCWVAMKNRCNRGGKYYEGVTVCESWQSFEAFLADMGERPSLKYSLDRYPNQSGNYEPGNVRWATSSQQMSNRRPFRRKPAAVALVITATAELRRFG